MRIGASGIVASSGFPSIVADREQPGHRPKRATSARVSQSASAARLAPDRSGEDERDRDRQQPPRDDVVVCKQPGESERDGEAHRDAPVVAHDEVPPEASEASHVAHARAPAGSSTTRRRRRTRTSTAATSPRNPAMPSTAKSEPGHSTPAPSPPQKMPKLVSRTPTTNLSEFSGTRSSGPRTARPTATTSTTAAVAAADAR